MIFSTYLFCTLVFCLYLLTLLFEQQLLEKAVPIRFLC